MLLQYVEKKLSYEVDVLHADKHESLYKLIVLPLMGLARQITLVNLQYICDTLRNKSGMKLMT